MKLNNLAAQAKHAALYTFITMVAAACTSSKEKLNQLDMEIDRLESQIDSVKLHNETIDSANHNPMLQILWKWIEEDAEHIDSLRHENAILEKKIQEKDLRKIAARYPLSAFLSKSDLKILKNQLSEYHSEWTKESAQNIITGRGTLQDLYNVSFSLDYSNFEAPFHIVNDRGYVRFNNARLNEYCAQFEKEIETVSNEDVAQKIKHHAQKTEFENNKQEIQRFEHMCDVSDSVYMAIDSHFAPTINHRLDSLKARRNMLRNQRNKLANRIHQK